MKISFFDSGIGGLSVLNAALRKFSGVEFLYFADTQNVPYGTKSKDEVIEFSLKAVEFLVSQGSDAVVVACNTATSAAIKELRAKFSIPIIGMEPAIKLAANRFPRSLILLIATPLTIKGEKLKSLIKSLNSEILTLPLPKLVQFAQACEFQNEAVKEYLHEELSKFDINKLSSLVLGCTHFNYFKDLLREILPGNVSLIDGIDGTINHLIDKLGGVKSFSQHKNSVKYFYSGIEVNSSQLAQISLFLNRLEAMRDID
ncbi:MAG: glutamate racemase [Campylobacter sp.]